MNNRVTTSQGAWLQFGDDEVIPLEAQFNIGRSAECKLVIPNDEVSREHARLQYDEAGDYWIIIDMGSTNGTYVNGFRLAKPKVLENEDKISIGKDVFTFCEWAHRADDPQSIQDEGDKTVTIIHSMPCWLVLLDVKQSTQLIQQLSAEEYSRKMRLWSKECETIVAGSSGQVNEYLGDGILAFWQHQSDSFELIGNMLKQFERLESKSGFDFRAVCHFGVVGFGGGMSSGLEKLAGTELNFLFKVEKSASATGKKLILTKAAAKLLSDRLRLLEAGEFTVVGFQGKHPLYVPADM